MRCTLLSALILIAGCTPSPAAQFPDHAAALEAVVPRLTGEQADAQDVARVRREGAEAYRAVLARTMDSPAFAARLRAHHLALFGLRDVREPLVHPITGQEVIVDGADAANLATWIAIEDQPWTALLTSDQCVDGDLSAAPCPDTNGGVHAGVLTQQGWLRRHARFSQTQRLRAIQRTFECDRFPDTNDPGIALCNACDPDDPTATPPADDPHGPLPRIHQRYKGTGTGGPCHACHTTLHARRPATVKYDVDGFYDAARTGQDAEPHAFSDGYCYAVPVGMIQSDLTPCCDPDGACLNFFDAQAQPGGCCFDPAFTDPNAADVHPDGGLDCADPADPWCTGFYHGHSMHHPRDWADLILDPTINNNAFYRCATTRLTHLAEDTGQGLTGLDDDYADPPTPPEDLDALTDAFENTGWRVRPFLLHLMTRPDFIARHAATSKENQQ